MHAFRAMQYCIDQATGLNVMGRIVETVPPVPEELFAYAIDAPPPIEIQYEITSIFPEWMQAMGSSVPLMQEGPTQVGTQGGIDPDSIDVANLLRDLDRHGYSDVLAAEVDEAVFGHPLARDVQQALRMAAMYDLYIDMRMQSLPAEPAPRRFWRVPGPEWILLGLGLATTASHAAAEVMAARARKKKRLTVSELAELIRKNERA